jgi:hypothetical protein
MDENNPSYEKGEFRLIQQLVKSLPNGLKIKQEVKPYLQLLCFSENFVSGESREGMDPYMT